MSYTPINWQTGQTITAEKLNKMDNGWSVESTHQTILNESVTTEEDYGDIYGYLSYSEYISENQLVITFNGNEYNCTGTNIDDITAYGGYVDGDYDFTEYPFAFLSYSDGSNEVHTPAEGTYTIKIENDSTTVQCSENFSSAVQSCVDTNSIPMLCVPSVSIYGDMKNATLQQRMLYFTSGGTYYIITQIIDEFSNVAFIPEDSNIEANFNENGIFTLTTLG